ncbi:MAG: S49 family peptidase, partial [Elusimicrobia bacterium]|nr:S49 family peptidase [Elusimicrobiota bacterium]
MEGRSLPEAQARPLADGRIFTGEQAKALKLVDEVGDSRVAIEAAAKLADLTGTPKVLRDGEPLENLLTMFELRLSRWLRPEAAILGELRDAAPTLEYRWSGF